MDLLSTFNSIPKEDLETITPHTEPSWYQKVHNYDMRHDLPLTKCQCKFRRNDSYVEQYETVNGALWNIDYVTEKQREQDKIHQQESRKTTGKSRSKRQRHRN